MGKPAVLLQPLSFVLPAYFWNDCVFEAAGRSGPNLQGRTDPAGRTRGSTPLLADGSWRRLIDAENHHGLSYEVILLARSFYLNQWAEALQVGAFDVLDVLCDLPKASEAAKRALGTAYLKRFHPRPEQG